MNPTQKKITNGEKRRDDIIHPMVGSKLLPPPCRKPPTTTTLTVIRGHRPNNSLGGKILPNKKGYYESCFREGEENYKLLYGKGMGRKFSLANFFLQNLWGKEKFFIFYL